MRAFKEEKKTVATKKEKVSSRKFLEVKMLATARNIEI
jgi:hypothetical protein